MNIPTPGRRKTDRLVAELAKAHFRLGKLYVCSVLRPALRSGDTAAALELLDTIEREATS